MLDRVGVSASWPARARYPTSTDARTVRPGVTSIHGGGKGPAISVPVEGQRPGPARPGGHREQDRSDLPDGEGLPPSLLADLMGRSTAMTCFPGSTAVGRRTGSSRNRPVHRRRPGPTTWAGCWKRYRDSRVSSFPAAPATCAASSRSRTSTRPGNRQRPPCTPITDRLLGLEQAYVLMLCLPEVRAAHRRARTARAAVREPRARPGFLRASTARCWCCCARTCTRPTSTPNATATPSPAPPGRKTCSTWSPPGTPTPRSPAARPVGGPYAPPGTSTDG